MIGETADGGGPDRVRLREATDADSAGVIALIERVFAEYPGNVLDVDGEEPGLRAPASSYDGFWVLERGGEVLGCSACVVRADDRGAVVLELKKVYLDRTLRGRGWGRRLIEAAESRAAAVGAHRRVAWSDTRFETAHAVYEALGYRRSGRSRELHDRSRSVELEFVKEAAPVEPGR